MPELPSVEDIERIVRSVVREELDARERPGDVLTREQLKKIYGWSDSTVRRKVKAGMPSLGRRFRQSDINRWLTQQNSYL